MKKQFYEWIFLDSWAGKLLVVLIKYKKSVCMMVTPVPMIFLGILQGNGLEMNWVGKKNYSFSIWFYFRYGR
jgi:hypothetical protein